MAIMFGIALVFSPDVLEGSSGGLGLKQMTTSPNIQLSEDDSR